MSTEKKKELDQEKPSTVKEGFQRWLIAAGFIVTLAFIYMFISLSKHEGARKEQDESLVTVPQQVQEGEQESKNTAIGRFKRQINNRTDEVAPEDNKINTRSIKKEYEPRKTASEEKKRKYQQSAQSAKNGRIKETEYEKFIKAEQKRAYMSLSAKDTIGDSASFYDDENQRGGQIKALEKAKEESIDIKRSKIKEQLELLAKYREGIQKGDIDPAQTPTALLNTMEPQR